MTRARPTPLLRNPVGRAVVAIVTMRLDAAAPAAERLETGRGAESLHDFRVGIRRLRAALRAYRPWLGKAASRTLRDRLRALARSTNEERDAEVQEAWIRASRRKAPARVRDEISRLLRDGRRHVRSRRKLVEEFTAIEAKLRRRLESVAPSGAEFSEVYTVLAAEHVEKAASCLAAIRGPDDVAKVHRARIVAKQLRYLLEPVAAEHAALRASVDVLAALQDALGELRDAQVFTDRWTRRPARAFSPAAVSYLLNRNAERCDRLFQDLRDRWLGRGAASTWEEIRQVLSRC